MTKRSKRFFGDIVRQERWGTYPPPSIKEQVADLWAEIRKPYKSKRKYVKKQTKERVAELCDLYGYKVEELDYIND